MANKTTKSTAATKATTPVKAAAVNATTDAKATTTKTVEVKAADVKADVKPVAVAAEKKAEAKKPVAKKPATKKTTTAKKAAPKKAEVAVSATYVLQYAGKEVVTSNILETVKKVWVEKFQGKLEEIKTIEIYMKPEENKAYFVINGLSNGDYFVEL